MARGKPAKPTDKHQQDTAADSKAAAKKRTGAGFSPGPRPFWSGVVSFGLVTLPVSLYPANRGKQSLLHMVDHTGTQLQRRYQCAAEQAMLSSEEIVRGYEVEKDQFVTVEDDELKALAPEKSSEIDLERFVSLSDISPIYFDKGYFLAPDPDAIKAYRLLAQSMEQENRAGIASFVMRDREYLVAIVAEAGILRAETLRFHDEIRSPEDIGLPALSNAKAEQVDQLRDAFASLAVEDLNQDELKDEHADSLLKKVEEKLKKKQDVVTEEPSADRRPAAAPSEDEEESAEIIDIMEIIKARIRGEQPPEPQQPVARPRQQKAKGKHARSKKSEKTASGGTEKDFNSLSKEALYQQAQKLDIDGRSKMSKSELIEALTSRST